MRQSTVVIDRVTMPFLGVNTLVVGSGAAALNAAIHLHRLGQRDIVVVTARWGGGTSANAGSDKQTYYKVSLAGDVADAPRQMASDLFAGGSMHGDIALCEAQHSAQAFYHLVDLGVPFPHDQFGSVPGYRTDHDPRGRATSAGPLTSKLMVEALAAEIRRRRIRVIDHHQVVALLADNDGSGRRIAGAVAVNTGPGVRRAWPFAVFAATNVVLGTGGPGQLYADSVYPEGHAGSIGIALEIGAIAQNLTESQFGLASIGFRWNVSGAYQQVIPRYVSTDAEEGDAREFLNDAFPDMRTLTSAVFRKGYQWPFDPRKVARHGSSLIDLLVYRERVRRGRRVFLDFSRNPDGGARLGPFRMDALDDEARTYLERSGAIGATPFERLEQINAPAAALYRAHGIDLAQSPIEIAVCAQHNNGGLAANLWWESNIRGLFPVGEVNGSHGVYRPGGASLNAGQVGGLRAALFITKRRSDAPPAAAALVERCGEQVRRTIGLGRRATMGGIGRRRSVDAIWREIRVRMTRCAGHLRDPGEIHDAIARAWMLHSEVTRRPPAAARGNLGEIYRLRESCLTHAVYLEAIGEYIAKGGQSRGSFVVVHRSGQREVPAPGGEWRFSLNRAAAFVERHILEIALSEAGGVERRWVGVRPIPRSEEWFEKVWKAFRDDQVVR